MTGLLGGLNSGSALAGYRPLMAPQNNPNRNRVIKEIPAPETGTSPFAIEQFGGLMALSGMVAEGPDNTQHPGPGRPHRIPLSAPAIPPDPLPMISVVVTAV